MGDIGHEKCTMLISGLAQGGILPIARVRRCTADNETRLVDACLRGKAVVVDQLSLRIKSVRERLEVN